MFKKQLVNKKKFKPELANLKAEKWDLKLKHLKYIFIKTKVVVESNFSLLKKLVILWPQQIKQEFKRFAIFSSHRTFEQKWFG